MNKTKARAVIRELSPVDKSNLLIEVVQWKALPAYKGSTSLWKIVDGSGALIEEFDYLGLNKTPELNLYYEKNMHLAWKVHIWALSYLSGYYDWVEHKDIQVYSGAQTMWLNEILFLCILDKKIFYEEKA